MLFQLWQIKKDFTDELILEMRANADAFNDTRKKWDGKTSRLKKKLAKVAVKRTPPPQVPPEDTGCPFKHLATGDMKYPTFDDPQIDPFGCGSWWVRVDMSVNTKQELKAA